MDAAQFAIFSLLVIANALICLHFTMTDAASPPAEGALWVAVAASALVLFAGRMVARARAVLLVFALLVHTAAWVMMANIVPDICMGILARSSASFAPQFGLKAAMPAYLTFILPLYWIAVAALFTARLITMRGQSRA